MSSNATPNGRKPRTTIRKRLLPADAPAAARADGLDIPACATVDYTSEDPAHPIDNLFDGARSSCWRAAAPDATQTILITFDKPHDLARLVYEVEEVDTERTQAVRIEASNDSGASFRSCLNQDYNFSPHGATFQREDLALKLPGTTHLRLTVTPNKSGSGVASLTTLRLYSATP